ncbi:MAG: YceH family protein [Gammaproteobacteria bacterium]
MSFELTTTEVRILGALLEKQVTTPDQYPLTLKSLVSACNQKSNRDPVLQLAESEVQKTVASMEQNYLISMRTEYGSRVTKHRQRFCNTEFGTLHFEPGELAVVCLLMLRGPQTAGELRSRSGRLHEFADVNEVTATLEGLASRDDGPFVLRLAREVGRRESRYAHLLGDDEPVAAPADELGPTQAPQSATNRINVLEERVAELESVLASLQARLGDT